MLLSKGWNLSNRSESNVLSLLLLNGNNNKVKTVRRWLNIEIERGRIHWICWTPQQATLYLYLLLRKKLITLQGTNLSLGWLCSCCLCYCYCLCCCCCCDFYCRVCCCCYCGLSYKIEPINKGSRINNSSVFNWKQYFSFSLSTSYLFPHGA